MPIGPLGGPMDFAMKSRKPFLIILLSVLFIHSLFIMSRLSLSLNKESTKIEKVIRLKLSKLEPEIVKNKLKKQIVQSENPEIEKSPTKDAFLSDKNRAFERETIARTVDVFKTKSSITAETKKSKSENFNKKNFKNLRLSDLGTVPMNDIESLSENKIEKSKQSLDQSKGVSSTNDFVEEVILGDFTRLNTTEYKHYGFFHRIRQKLEQFWGRSIREKADALYRSGRRIPASENLITSLQVTLNEKGEVIKVKILSTSGVRELDSAAIDSFNQAGPFPNPPRDLLVNGRATIEWGFVIKS